MHVIGKGILRFHAVYWLGLLLSAGEPLPTHIAVHDYLTVDGVKLSKSAGNAVRPIDLIERCGVDAVRWWLLREVATLGETDFTIDRLVRRADTDLSGRLGNLVNRVVTLVWKYRDGRVPVAGAGGEQAAAIGAHGARLASLTRDVAGAVDAALAGHDFRAAIAAIWRLVDGGNALVERARPWELASAERAGDAAASVALDTVLGILIAACRRSAVELSPFIPSGAGRLLAQLGRGDAVAPASPCFPAAARPDAEAGVAFDGDRARSWSGGGPWLLLEQATGFVDVDGCALP